jgi:hypothetical protein
VQADIHLHRSDATRIKLGDARREHRRVACEARRRQKGIPDAA